MLVIVTMVGISKTTNKSWWYVTSFKLLRKWAKVSVLLLKVSSLLSVSFTKRIPCSCCYSDIGDDNAKHAKKRSYYSVYNAEYSTTFRNTVLHFLGNTSTTHLGAVCFRVVLTHIKEMKNVPYYTLMQISKALIRKCKWPMLPSSEPRWMCSPKHALNTVLLENLDTPNSTLYHGTGRQ